MDARYKVEEIRGGFMTRFTDAIKSEAGKSADIQSNTPKGVNSRKYLNPLEKDANDFAFNGNISSGISSFSMPKDQAIDHDETLSFGTGLPLSEEDQVKFSSILGYDFSDVRIHSDASAAHAAEEMGAAAFSKGDDIVLGQGEYNSGDPKSEDLLAHEMMHVAQSKSGKTDDTILRADKDATALGRTPPTESYKTTDNPGPEDSHVLFNTDSVRLDKGDLKTIESFSEGLSEPVDVDIYGYASHEGPEEYNHNLSAHRAMEVKDALEGLLPFGSFVTVYAVGETHHFGKPNQNRRVGVHMKPSLLAMPVMPFFPTLPELDLSMPSLPPDTNQLPYLPDLALSLPTIDFGDMSKSAGKRGRTIDGPLGDSAIQLYDQMMVDNSLPLEIRHLWVQMTIDALVEDRMKSESPSKWDEIQSQMEAEDKINGTSRTMISIPVLKIYDYFRKKDEK